MENDIIVAQATAQGKSGISIIRLSGKNCLNVAKQIFESPKIANGFEPNYLYLGMIDLGEIKDKGFCVYFKSPHSYTGEDVVEFQCHGGYLVGEKIIKKCLEKGARLAEPGEFSKRAFLNGKMTLDEAEGVIDTINAENESQLKAGNDLARGELFKSINELQVKLTDLLAEIDVNFDYPEHDIEYKTKKHIKNEIEIIKKNIDDLLKTEERGQLIKQGINVAIVGKTNVGKSSLLNSLINYEQAIVTDIEGTTRDIVNASIEYKGIKINFYDTAGLRQTNDKIEQIGINKAKEIMKNCDVILFILDASKTLSQEEIDNLKNIDKEKTIFIFNKCDKKLKITFDYPYIEVSAKEKTNIDRIKEQIYNLVVNEDKSNSIVLTNLRHIETLKQSKEIVLTILNSLKLDLTLDLIALDINNLWTKLGEITGQTANEEIINKIFSKFCLGK